MKYEDKAFAIVKNAISSAIFIDEKARDFYSENPLDEQVVEEKLSIGLHSGFKSAGISLAVHKFDKSDLYDTDLKHFFFRNRDLILLDWELDDVSGEQYSLSLLSDVVSYPHLNFCCIYTRSQRFEQIHSQIQTYFFGLSLEDFDRVVDAYSHLDEGDIASLFKNLDANVVDREVYKDIGVDLDSHPFVGDSSFGDIDLLWSIYFAFLKNFKSKQREKKATAVLASADSFIINNTFIFLLRKDSDNDPDPNILLRRISNEVMKNKNSFIQLLGLEMQTIFNSNERFVDENLLNSSSSALFTHRNYLMGLEKSDMTFKSIIKKVLIEHANLKLRTAKLSLLDTDFLDAESPNYSTSPSRDELLALNTFYNSVTVKGINDTDVPSLNFGDVFKDEGDTYFVCITALCDCYYPNKIDHNFYFAVGSDIDPVIALKLGDTAFVSFLPSGRSIIWGNIEFPKVEKIKKAELSNDEFKLKKLEAEKAALENFVYKPFYIKPKLFNVDGSKILKNSLSVRELTYKVKNEVVDENIVFTKLEYICTLRPDYAQRIANHSFGHPARVGVDFVKM
jgi:hypothetical protein